MVGFFVAYYAIFHGYLEWAGAPFPMWVNRNLLLAVAIFGNACFLAVTRDYCCKSLPAGRLTALSEVVTWLLLAGGMVLLVAPFRMGVDILLVLICICYPTGLLIALRSAWVGRAWQHWLMATVWLTVLLVVLLLFARFYAWFPLPLAVVDMQRFLMLLIFLLFFAIVTSQQQSIRAEAERARRAEDLATRAQLDALRYQLNPHFLFNTLTSIDALSRKAPDRIAALVRKLSLYLRLRLQPPADGMTPFGKEWKSVKAYFDIEQVRYANALHIHHQVHDEVMDIKVPDMLQPPLAENVIKHGLSEAETLEVRFIAQVDGPFLVIRVENTGSLNADVPQKRVGVGLRNVRNRLSHVYGDTAFFDIREADGWVVAELMIPLEEKRG